jgi:ubiquinone/menaquinone biosynthesis C-methylase UbiE
MATDLADLTHPGSRALRATTVQRFDRWAPTYDACSLQPVYRAAHESLIEIAHTLTPKPRRILDLGCGTGQLLRHLRTTMPDANVVGVDASCSMLSMASAQGSGIAWVGASAEQLPFAGATFDLVTASFTARHWSDMHRAVGEAARVLTPTGTLAIADAFTDRRRGVLADLLRRGCTPPTPLLRALMDAGLYRYLAWSVDGYGPIPTITILTALRDAPLQPAKL